jgi:hypothetical protein
MTPRQLAQIETIKSIVTSLLPLAPPGVQLALGLATNALNAVQKAQNQGKDVTREQLAALFAADDAAKADDQLAQEQARNSNPKP